MGGGAEAIERAMEGDMFLKALKGVWDDHTGSMHKLTAVLRYMVSHAGQARSRREEKCDGLIVLGQGIYAIGWLAISIRSRSLAVPPTYRPITHPPYPHSLDRHATLAGPARA